MEPPLVLILSSFALTAFVVVLAYVNDHEGWRSEARWHRDAKRRERLTADQFYERFYRESELSREFIEKLLWVYSVSWGIDQELLRPEDDFVRIFGGLCVDDFVERLETAFDVQISEEEYESIPDATFDTIARVIYSKASTGPIISD